MILSPPRLSKARRLPQITSLNRGRHERTSGRTSRQNELRQAGFVANFERITELSHIIRGNAPSETMQLLSLRKPIARRGGGDRWATHRMRKAYGIAHTQPFCR